MIDVNDFAFRPSVRGWIAKEEPQVFSYWSLNRLYEAVASYLDMPANADIAATLDDMGLSPRQTEGGWWRLVFDKEFAT